MNISGLGSVDWSALSSSRKATQSESNGGFRVDTSSTDSVTLSSQTNESSSANTAKSPTTTYNLHNITRGQLLNLLGTGGLSSTGDASGAITVTGNTWVAAPGTSFSGALMNIVCPPSVDGSVTDPGKIPGSIDLFKVVQDQIGFEKSIGDTRGAQLYQGLLNTITSLTDKNGIATADVKS